MSDRSHHRFGLVLDCADPHRLAEFWAAALGYVTVGAARVSISSNESVHTGGPTVDSWRQPDDR